MIERARICSCTAKYIAEWLVSTAAASSSLDQGVHCVLPGGTTPLPILEVLQRLLPRHLNITFSLTDERCVPLDDALRNEAPVVKAVGNSRVQSLLDSESLSPCRWIAAPQIALVGMGTDGHVASLFPGSTALEAAEKGDAYSVVPVADAPDGIIRVSRTFAGLSGSDATAILISGREKRRVIRLASQGKAVSLPLSRLLQRTPELTIFDLQ